MGLEVDKPVRADHRYLYKMLSNMGGVALIPEEFSLISRVFVKAGGSWRKLFLGSVDDTEILRKVIKAGIKKGHISKAEKW